MDFSDFVMDGKLTEFALRRRIADPACGASIVTGATGGLGYEMALGLARAGLKVLMTGRDRGRGRRRVAPGAGGGAGARSLRFALLDVCQPRRPSPPSPRP